MAGQIQRDIQSSVPLPSIEVEVFLNIQRTADVLTRAIDAALAPASLEIDQFNILRILRGAGTAGRASSDVRTRMVRDSSRFPAHVHALRTRALITGALTLAITDSGRDLLTTVDAAVIDAVRARMRDVPPATLRTVIDALERMRAGER